MEGGSHSIWSLADGKVTGSKSERSVEYAALVKGQQLTQSIPAEDPLTPGCELDRDGSIHRRKWMGVDFVTGNTAIRRTRSCRTCGTARYFARLPLERRCSQLDSKKAEQMGAIVVHDGNFVGVAAPSSGLAAAAIAAIHAEWKSEPQPSSKELFNYLKTEYRRRQDPAGDGDRYRHRQCG